MRKNPSRFFMAVAAVGLLTSLGACQVKPGDYRIYKITFLPATYQADCGVYPDPRDYTTFFGASTIGLFATDTNEFFLEYDVDVITGVRSGTDYTFEADEVIVDDPSDNTTVTRTRALDVALSIKGYKLTGEFVSFTSEICGGACQGYNNVQCTMSGTFVGTEIKDVEFERGV